mgnify:CR=1 FL=1
MFICHFSLWAPARSGLFEFVIDQIKAERNLGLRSEFINCDVERPDPARFQYEGIQAVPWNVALDKSAIWVLHRSIPYPLYNEVQNRKSVAILHGTSEIMILHEVDSRSTDDKFNLHLSFLKNFEKVVAITKSDYDIMKQYDTENKVVYINDAIDVNRFSPCGYAWPFRYRPALISTCNIRINKHPSFYIWAMPSLIRRIPSARLNIFGINLVEMPTWRNVVLKSPSISVAIENIHGQFFDLRPFLRGADISLNSNYNGIFSRDSMEAMACGCSVVAFTNEHTEYVCERRIDSIVDAICRAWEDILEDPEGQIEKNRAYAVEHFSMEKIVREGYIPLYESLRR